MQIKTKVISLLCVGLLACSVHIKADLNSMKQAFETINGMLDRSEDISEQAEKLYDEMYNVLGAEGTKKLGLWITSYSSLEMTDTHGPYYEILINMKNGFFPENRTVFYSNLLRSFSEYQQKADSFCVPGSHGHSLSLKGIRIMGHTEDLKILASLLFEDKLAANIEGLKAYFDGISLSHRRVYFDNVVLTNIKAFVENCGEDFGWKDLKEEILDVLKNQPFKDDEGEGFKSDKRSPYYYIVPGIVVGGAAYAGYKSDKCSIV